MTPVIFKNLKGNSTNFVIIFDISKKKIPRHIVNTVLECALTFLNNKGIFMFVDNHVELKEIRLLPLFFLLFLLSEYKFRLQTHVVVPLYCTDINFVVIFVIFTLLHQDAILNHKAIELPIPVVEHSEGNFLDGKGILFNFFQQMVSLLVHILELPQFIPLSYAHGQLTILGLFNVDDHLVFVLLYRQQYPVF